MVYDNLILDNNGERLVPGFSHNEEEYIRHRSTYKMFYDIIIRDILNTPEMLQSKIKILELGSGSGHGTFLLSQIPNSEITALEISAKAVEFAHRYYYQNNIKYLVSSVSTFDTSEEYDYIISRHALEHVENGLEVPLRYKCKKRILISVPYKEAEVNDYHILTNIDENCFDKYSNVEFVYENLEGEEYTNLNYADSKNSYTNSITAISTIGNMPKVTDIMSFPLVPYRTNGIEKIFYENQDNSKSAGGFNTLLQSMIIPKIDNLSSTLDKSVLSLFSKLNCQNEMIEKTLIKMEYQTNLLESIKYITKTTVIGRKFRKFVKKIKEGRNV